MVYSSYETSFMDYSLKFIRRVYLYMASIRDVAKEAGVAICTVSRLINGTANVEPETQKKIEDAMKKLDYVPNELARGMFKGDQTPLRCWFQISSTHGSHHWHRR